MLLDFTGLTAILCYSNRITLEDSFDEASSKYDDIVGSQIGNLLL